MKKLYSVLLLVCLGTELVCAQVPRKIIVEHFTNTLCGICSFKNPPFYNNLAGQDGVLHIAYHPSAPYSSCVLNQHNVAGNDDRTNFYNTYGSTPDFFFQGVFTPGDVSMSSVFDPYEGMTSPASMEVVQTAIGTDSINVRVVVKTEAAHSLAQQLLYVALVEDTLFYNAPNGENEHYDVFRVALTAAGGDMVNLPAVVGDSIYLDKTVAAHPAWDFERMYAIAILQDEVTKEVEQSAGTTTFRTSGTDTTIASGILNTYNGWMNIFPNPFTSALYIESDLPGSSKGTITDLSGRLVQNIRVDDRRTVLHLNTLEPGVYMLKLEGLGSRILVKY